MWEFYCSNCGKWHIFDEPLEGSSFTYDCGSRIMYHATSGVTVDLNLMLNALNPAWPVDGAGTGFIELSSHEGA